MNGLQLTLTFKKSMWNTPSEYKDLSGATRARKTLHLLRTDYKFNYPIGADYLIYVQEKNDK